MNKKRKIIVGMSGGVDSSVTALLLKKQGYEVEGLFMKNWEEDDTENYCAATDDRLDAENIAEKLGIPFHTMNFSAEYWDHVFENFVNEHLEGRTPNPDILCNREIKFKAFFNYAIETLGADAIATGHYASVANHNGQYQLLKGLDENKDQTYFLYTIQGPVLAKTLFPLGTLKKSEVRQIAAENNLSTAEKKDSVGICFIGKRKFSSFLNRYIEKTPGNMVTPEGEIIARHQGLSFYTIGQRHGLGIGGLKNKSDLPWYVADKNLSTNQLIVVQGEHPKLYHRSLTAKELTWVNDEPTKPLTCQAKIRYRQSAQKCQVSIQNGKALVLFDDPQRAITPGQSVVFYDNHICLGGGIIAERAH